MKKKMRAIGALLLCALLLIMTVGCGSAGQSASAASSAENAAASQPPASEAEVQSEASVPEEADSTASFSVDTDEAADTMSEPLPTDSPAAGEDEDKEKRIENLESQIAALESKVEAMQQPDSGEEVGEEVESGEFTEEVDPEGEEVIEVTTTTEGDVLEDLFYTDAESVALYLVLYGHLPYNYITKEEARELGWEGGDLTPYAPGMSIGGSRFGNYEGLLPKAKGRKYYECDIDYEGGRRNAKRLVYSDDGLVFYTEDHYTSFEQLY